MLTHQGDHTQQPRSTNTHSTPSLGSPCVSFGAAAAAGGGGHAAATGRSAGSLDHRHAHTPASQPLHAKRSGC